MSACWQTKGIRIENKCFIKIVFISAGLQAIEAGEKLENIIDQAFFHVRMLTEAIEVGKIERIPYYNVSMSACILQLKSDAVEML